jgi:hypothetical protein
MAVKRRLLGYSGMRVDWPHLRSIESSTANDFDMLCRGMFTGINRPYISKGFDIQIPASAIYASQLTITVADSTIVHSSASESGTILNLPTTQPDEVLSPANPRVIGAFQANALNYVALDYRRITDTSTVDNTAGWSPSQLLEYQRTVPIGQILDYRFIISTSGFSTYLPLYIVQTTNTGAVQYITKAVTDFWRLGTGGANPNPYNSFNWGNISNTQPGANPRREWIGNVPGASSLTVQPGDPSTAFSYGDFSIHNLKDFVDAVWTRFKEITGSQYGYFDSTLPGPGGGSGGPGLNLHDVAFDSIGSILTGAGELSYNLVLASAPPLDGAFQSSFTDPSALPGDFYVLGSQSGTQATITSFNAGNLLVNSLTSNVGFINNPTPENIQTRRIFRPNLSKWILSAYSRSDSTANRYANLSRIPAGVGALTNNLASWSFVNISSPTSEAGWTLITVNTSTPHGVNPGQFVRVLGLLASGSTSPDGVHRVLRTPSTTQFTIAVNVPMSGTCTIAGSNGVVLDTQDRHPYNPSLPIAAFAPATGTQAYITVPNNSFNAPQSLLCNMAIGSNIITNITTPSKLYIGMLVVSANLPGGSAHITRVVSPTSVEVSQAAIANITGATIAVQQQILLQGLQATGFTSQQLDGVRTIVGLGVSGQLIVDLGVTVTTTSLAANASVDQLYYKFPVTVTGATPNQYDVLNYNGFAIANDKVSYYVGLDTLPTMLPATGAIKFDGVTSNSVILQPVTVTSIVNDGSGNLTVTTASPPGLVTSGPLNFTIFGNSALSDYIRTYTGVNIAVITGTPTINPTPSVDAITGATVPPSSGFNTGQLYTNGGTSGWQGNNFTTAASSKLGKIRIVGGAPVGSPTGNVLIDVYASTAAVTGVPTGSPIATSDPVLASSITNLANIDFSFAGAGFPTLPAGNYVWMARGTTTNASNAATIKSTGTGPATYGDAVASNNSGSTWSAVSYSNYYQIFGATNVFVIQNTGIVGPPNYTAGPNDGTTINLPNNPYSGPVQWSADLVVKGIVGDLSYTIPQTATVDTTDPNNDPLANAFNVNGQTGTAFLQDGEVLYIKLERNDPVSSDTIYTTKGGSNGIVTTGFMLDAEGNQLVAGDFIKFAAESDAYWIRIKTITSGLVTFVTDRGQDPTITQRPAASGPMVYCKGSYSKLYVKKHYLVDTSPDIYWLAVRRDNGAQGLLGSKVYFRNLELAPGEVRPVSDGVSNNLLVYTGANSEGATNPNYSVSDQTGDAQFTASLTIAAVDNLTQMVTFGSGPGNIPQTGDTFTYNDGSSLHYYTILQPVSSRTVVVEQPTSALVVSGTVTYYRQNQFIQDSDNLTLALRKEDREAGFVHTSLTRPVYDESMYIQQMNIGGSGTVRSGSYVYQGPITNPTALAWVMHGNAPVTETIESASITMPGGHSSIGPNAILVNIVFGTFSDGTGLFQNGSSTGRTVNNPGNPPFTAPSVYGDNSGGGVELVLPPNERTEVVSSGGIVVYGTHSFYKQSTNVLLTGEELLVIVNDGIREAYYDYTETFGGPKAKIQLIRALPINTRIRFRVMSAYGSAVAAAAANVSLQTAYTAGNSIICAVGVPVAIQSSSPNTGEVGLNLNGSLAIGGGTAKLGGIYNVTGDQGFQIGNETNKPQNVWAGIDNVKTHSGYLGSANIKTTAAQTVTGASGTIITGSTLTLQDNFAYRIKVNATARRSDGTFGVASFSMEGTFHCESGVAAASGSPVSVDNGFDGDGANYAIVFAISGNQVMAVVYGSTGATVQWALTIEQQGVGLP